MKMEVLVQKGNAKFIKPIVTSQDTADFFQTFVILARYVADVFNMGNVRPL